MTRALLFLAAVVAAAGANAADFGAPRVDIGEGKISSVYECDVMPKPATLAEKLLAALAAEKKSQSLKAEVRLFPKTPEIDPASLKVVYDVEVPYFIYDASDGPRSKTITFHEKIWSGPAAEFDGEPAMILWEVDVGCGQDLIDAFDGITKDRAFSLATRLKRAQGRN